MKQLLANEIDMHSAANKLNIQVHDIEVHLADRHSLEAIIEYRRQRLESLQSPVSEDNDLSILELSGSKEDYKRTINNLLKRMNRFLIDVETKPLTRSQDIRAATALTREMRGCIHDLPEIERTIAETRQTEFKTIKVQFDMINQWMMSRDGLCPECRQRYIELTDKLTAVEEEPALEIEGEVIN